LELVPVTVAESLLTDSVPDNEGATANDPATTPALPPLVARVAAKELARVSHRSANTLPNESRARTWHTNGDPTVAPAAAAHEILLSAADIVVVGVTIRGIGVPTGTPLNMTVIVADPATDTVGEVR